MPPPTPPVAHRTDPVPRPAVEPGAQRDVVVVGASAGGVEALGALVRDLPPELGAAVFVVLHVLPTGTSVLANILARAGSLPARAARDGEPIEQRGRIYVAPPDHHMLVTDGAVRLTRGPRENGHRPAVDPLFRSAARAYGKRVIGVVLSGSLDDGTAGLAFVKRRGGTTVAQDPNDALYSSMPSSAIGHDAVDHVVAVDRMAGVLCDLIDTPLTELGDPPAGGRSVDDDEPPDHEATHGVHADRSDDDPRRGALSGLTCPECGGALYEQGSLPRYACQVGHVYSPESLEAAQSNALEAALWAALRSMDERADLFRRLARRGGPSRRMAARAEKVEQHATVLRELVMRSGRESRPEAAGEARVGP